MAIIKVLKLVDVLSPFFPGIILLKHISLQERVGRFNNRVVTLVAGKLERHSLVPRPREIKSGSGLGTRLGETVVVRSLL